MLILIYRLKSQYDSSEIATRRAKEIFIEIGDNNGLGKAYNGLANILTRKGKFDKSIELYIKAAEVFNLTRNQKNLATIYVNIEMQNKELASYAIQLAKQNEVSKNISKNVFFALRDVNEENRKKLKLLVKSLKIASKPQNAWKEFELRFNEVHVDFAKSLQAKYPELSRTEIRVCSLLRLSLSSKEIAQRSFRTVEKTRSNIRKKMGLEKEQNLTSHILLL